MLEKFLKEGDGFSMVRLQGLIAMLMGLIMVLTGAFHAIYLTIGHQDIDNSFVTICFSGSSLVSGIGIAGKVVQKRFENKKRIDSSDK